LRIQANEAVDAEPRPPTQLDAVETMFVRRDHRGWLWIGTGSGVFVFNGAAWRHVTELDGLTWDDCNEGAFLDDKDGSVWIGTSNGLSHLLNPERLFEPRTLRIIAVDAALGDAAIPVNSSASFAWTLQPLRVHVVSSALDDQSSIVYRYRLVGLEEEWASSKSQDLHYTSLPDGEYSLEVYAEDANRGIRSPLTVIAFQMRPPWWRSTAFEILLAVFLLALGYGILRFRERHLTARQAELESLVRARTEELELERRNFWKRARHCIFRPPEIR